MSQRRFAVVTTCHAAGYDAYGRVMVETFLEHWPHDVPLMLYHEGFTPPSAPGRIESQDLNTASPELVAFKARHHDNPRAVGQWRPHRRLRVGPLSIPLPWRVKKAAYRWDAVRFSHKSYAIFDAARRTDADALIWIDADTRFFADVDVAELYDGFTFNCLSWLEGLGFCGIGEARDFLDGGKAIARDGVIPLDLLRTERID